MHTPDLLSRLPEALGAVRHRLRSRNAFLIGGAVVDLLSGREPKDWDIEVFGITPEDLEALFADKSAKSVGRSFGIVKVVLDGLEVDLSVPRRDSRGTGHAVHVRLDPSMTPKEAARRRDFTINTLGISLETGAVLDPFGGLDDLERGILRVTDPETFVEDPLRALRAMQLLARKAREIDPGSLTLLRSMVESFPTLPRERVGEEFAKLLLKAERPSVGLDLLRASGWIVHFPELEALIGCPQHPDWHPEGDVWTHSLLAVDAAAQIRHLVPEAQREGFMLGVLCHDLGKPEATITPAMIDRRDPTVAKKAADAGVAVEDMLWTAHGHDVGGVEPAERLLRRMTGETRLIKMVQGLVAMHMRPFSLVAGHANEGAFARLHRQMRAVGGDLRLLGRVCQCDACASGPDWNRRSLRSGAPNWEHATSERLFAFAESFDASDQATLPKVQGRDLVTRGLLPGPRFTTLLRRALDLQDEDASLTRDEILDLLFREGMS